MVVFIFYIVIALLVVVPIKMGKIMTKMHINNLHTDGDKEINRYTLPIKNTYDKSYVKVEIIQRDIKKATLWMIHIID